MNTPYDPGFGRLWITDRPIHAVLSSKLDMQSRLFEFLAALLLHSRPCNLLTLTCTSSYAVDNISPPLIALALYEDATLRSRSIACFQSQSTPCPIYLIADKMLRSNSYSIRTAVFGCAVLGHKPKPNADVMHNASRITKEVMRRFST